MDFSLDFGLGSGSDSDSGCGSLGFANGEVCECCCEV